MRTIYLLIPFFLYFSNLHSQIAHGNTPFDWSNKSIEQGIDFLSFPRLDMKAIHQEDNVVDEYKETPYRFGIDIPVSIDFFDQGEIIFSDADYRVWRLGIHCLDATSINFIFGEYNIPEGGEVFVYNESKSDFLGSFTAENNKDYGSLAVGLIHSDKIIIEYKEPNTAVGQASLFIDQITHGYRHILNKFETDRGPFGNSGSCNININCADGDPWQDEKRGIGLILEGGFAICTGSLINNTNNDGTPYFLTAAHCDGNESNWIIFFNHEYVGCNNTGSASTNQSISGGIELASTAPSDAHLIQLSQDVPASYAPYFNGWNRSGSVPLTGVCIHHPNGDVKKISFDDDPIQKTNYGSFTITPSGDHWRIESWERNTTTEPGSSGAPLFDHNHRIIGQLHGGGSTCNNNLSDWYGAMHSSFSTFSSYLAPGSPSTLFVDGYDPQAVIGPITVSLKVYMQGPYNPSIITMSDQLRQNNLIPLTEPYTELGFTQVLGGGESMNSSVLNTNGGNAIVDWIFVELRSGDNPAVVVATQSGLIQRDGDIVRTDGASPLIFNDVEETSVFVAIKHRNHLGFRSNSTYSTSAPIIIDFRNTSADVFGNSPMAVINNKLAMYAGDANHDGQVNGVDLNTYWRVQNSSTFLYLNSSGDFDLNGAVNSIDRNDYWRINNAKSAELE